MASYEYENEKAVWVVELVVQFKETWNSYSTLAELNSPIMDMDAFKVAFYDFLEYYLVTQDLRLSSSVEWFSDRSTDHI